MACNSPSDGWLSPKLAFQGFRVRVREGLRPSPAGVLEMPGMKVTSLPPLTKAMENYLVQCEILLRGATESVPHKTPPSIVRSRSAAPQRLRALGVAQEPRHILHLLGPRVRAQLPPPQTSGQPKPPNCCCWSMETHIGQPLHVVRLLNAQVTHRQQHSTAQASHLLERFGQNRWGPRVW